MVVNRTQAAGIPLDIPYADIDYMERYTDFTVGEVRKICDMFKLDYVKFAKIAVWIFIQIA